MVALSPESRALASLLREAISDCKQSGRARQLSLQLEEFEGCRYNVESDNSQPGLLTISFKAACSFLPEAEAALKAVNQDIARVSCSSDWLQLHLEIDIPHLCRFDESRQEEAIRQLSQIRLMAIGFPLRVAMRDLASGCASPCSFSMTHRPGAPYFVTLSAETMSILFPIWPRKNQNDLLTAAFAQEFAEARRAPGLSDAPQCSVTFPGKRPPVQLDQEQQKLLGSFKGLFVMFTYEPRHFSSDEGIDKAVWMLLTFYAQLELHAQSLKALIHSKMRENANALLSAVENSQTSQNHIRSLV